MSRRLPWRVRQTAKALVILLLIVVVAYSQEYQISLYDIGVVAFSCVALIYLGSRITESLHNRRALSEFGENPARFDKQIIELEGRVVKVLSDTFAEKARRRMTDKLRTAADNPDGRGRFIHQRFLISSKEMKYGSSLLVEHNINYGKLKLRTGSKVRVRGEYLHTVGSGHHIYGRIHKTHEPDGWVKAFR